MSLLLNKLTHVTDDLAVRVAGRMAELESQLPTLRAELDSLAITGDDLWRKIEAAQQYRWAGAIPVGEPVNAAFPALACPPRVNVIAADGSQIHPDRHGIALYYLINIGSIVFRHGTPEAPQCHSQPEVFYKDGDLYEHNGDLIAGPMIDARRDVRELGELARLAASEAASAPTVALLDNGLLLYVAMQATSPASRRAAREVIDGYLAHLDTLRESGAAVAGIVDRPRAAGVVRLLHLNSLEPGQINDDSLRDLGHYRRVTDRTLFQTLRPGERSAVFDNASPPNREHYQPRGHSIHFFYLNAGPKGNESILRVEVPEWVAGDPRLLDLTHAAIVEQCRVTGGFPYVLMRAHELAVVTGAERGEFDQMIAGALIRRGLTPRISQKAIGKRWTSGEKRRYP